MTQFRTPVERFGRACLLASVALLSLAVPAMAVNVGEYAPSFNLMDLDGQSHSLSDCSGKVILLCFFGYNASVCSESMRQVQSNLASQYGSRGLVVLGIECWDGTSEQVQQFGYDAMVSFPLLLGGRDCASGYGLPYNSFVLIDASGVVRDVWQGPDASAFDLSAIDQGVTQLLAEANAVNEQTWGRIKTLYGRKVRLT